MKKRKGIKILLIVLTVLSALVLSGALIIGVYAEKNVDFEKDEALFYASQTENITKFYYDGSGFFGKYPDRYAYNTETEISDLKFQVDNYQFGGWYLDEECEIEFDGTVDANRRGELKLYADFIDLNNNKYWTPNF